MAGLTLGLGGGAGLYSGKGSNNDGKVFASPITPDLTAGNTPPVTYPATWIILGALVVTAVIYAHWHVY